ncbi:MAG TPA: AMP-binding protein, partial [Vicinamibacterales bacterium]|nr:AMP-binding protein [Vicinamibacterales bacterium]
MATRTLADFFTQLTAIGSDPRLEFLVYDDGYRTWSWSYAQVTTAARAMAARLRDAGISKGQAVVLWGENRPEWIAALWGCILEGVVAVPIDYRASADFMQRVAAIVDARAILAGEVVEVADAGRPVWPLTSLRAEPAPTGTPPAADATPDDTAQIIFTSGATAEPKGVVLTHRNILANVTPIEREIEKYRRYARPFAPIRFLNLLPLSHMFG